jgi:hypothetical protein
MEYCVFIQTNHKQWLGALVAEYALRRNSPHHDKFDIRIMEYKDYPFMSARDGDLYLRDGDKRPWASNDLQSFTPTRFLPPELMGYQGRSVVIDPDVFAVGDVWELLSRDMQGKALMCRPKSGNKGKRGCLATSVMLLDNAQLTHWKVEEQFNAMFEFKRDYMKWVCLKYEDPETIGLFENEWNDFDHLTDQTKMVHNTKRKTQPWKTGLPVDFRPADTFQLFPPKHWIRRARRALGYHHWPPELYATPGCLWFSLLWESFPCRCQRLARYNRNKATGLIPSGPLSAPLARHRNNRGSHRPSHV